MTSNKNKFTDKMHFMYENIRLLINRLQRLLSMFNENLQGAIFKFYKKTFENNNRSYLILIISKKILWL